MALNFGGKLRIENSFDLFPQSVFFLHSRRSNLAFRLDLLQRHSWGDSTRWNVVERSIPLDFDKQFHYICRHNYSTRILRFHLHELDTRRTLLTTSYDIFQRLVRNVRFHSTLCHITNPSINISSKRPNQTV